MISWGCSCCMSFDLGWEGIEGVEERTSAVREVGWAPLGLCFWGEVGGEEWDFAFEGFG